MSSNEYLQGLGICFGICFDVGILACLYHAYHKYIKR